MEGAHIVNMGIRRLFVMDEYTISPEFAGLLALELSFPRKRESIHTYGSFLDPRFRGDDGGRV